MQFDITNVARTELAIAGSASALPMSYKPDSKGNIKTGSMALVTAFGSKDVRNDIGRALYIKWLTNGTYRPLVQDMVSECIPKSAQPWVNIEGAVNKAGFIAFCQTVVQAFINSGKEPKGKKLFLFDIARMVVAQAQADAGEGDVVGNA